MSFGGTLVAIIAIIAIVILRGEKYRALGHHRSRDRLIGPPPAAAETAELERELAELRKRVAVLERIATDGRQSRAIAEEIEALRDR